MRRYSGNPILKPIPEHPWESKAVLNPAILQMDNTIHIVYRAVDKYGVSRLGLALANGPAPFARFPEPVFMPERPDEMGGVEDPRITRIGSNLIMCYTAFEGLTTELYQAAFTNIELFTPLSGKFICGPRRRPFPGIKNKNTAFFPKLLDSRYALLHRIEPAICIAYTNDFLSWYDSKAIVQPRPGRWDSLKIGIAGPPIELEESFMLIYHGVAAGPNNTRRYALGAVLLSKKNPEIVLGRTDTPIFMPTENYEIDEQGNGIVFSCGQAILGDELLLYYGAADNSICVATFELEEILEAIKK